jgi:very-short-patch-repair endonuclease
VKEITGSQVATVYVALFAFGGRVARAQEDKKQLFLSAWHMLRPGAPEPIAEYWFARPRRYRADWCWPDRKTIVEVDGGQYMARMSQSGRLMVGGRHNGDDDRWKMCLAASLGYRVLRFSPSMLETDPERCCQLVERALGAG